MTTIGRADGLVGSGPGLFERNRIIAKAGFNRWLVPAAALCIHLCIGMAYGFSVFWLPLSRALGITAAKTCPDMTLVQELFTTTCDWRIASMGWMFTLFFVLLGVSAAIWGGWLERVGPRKAGAVAACCWAGGLMLGGIGVYIHQLWLMWLGAGVIGGVGLGLGYISPVSTLIKWFPDRPGMATGMAIMGFGGGAFIASPLSVYLMSIFRTADYVGVAPTFVVMGAIYFVFMMVGAFIVRVPAPGWKPEGYTPPVQASKLITTSHVFVYDALKTPQFWLIWWILCLNVTAGIGVLGQASAMSQEMFPGHITPVAAAGFVGLMSLFNMGGRFFWASTSDYIGRKNTYFAFMVLGFALYCTVPYTGAVGSVEGFVVCFLVIISMYGGGFSTVPAYLKDMFGTRYVGAIHGWLLTAWSMAGIFGPVLVNYIREYNITHGVPKAQAYNVTMYIMAGLLVIGFICNLLVKAVHRRFHMHPEHEAELAQAEVAAAGEPAGA